MRWIALASGLSLAASLNTCQPTSPSSSSSAPPSAAEVKQIDERVQDYFRKTANLPATVTLKVLDVQAASAPGLLTADLEASNGTNTQKVPLVLSRDGRYLIQGQLTDLSVDPFKGTMDKIDLKNQPMRGNPNAAVTIVEYSDFQCPFCSKAYATLEDQVLKEYGDKVRFVFKNFPLTSIHPWAESGALAVECAGQQKPEAFWKLYNFLFQEQASISLGNLKEKAGAALKNGGFDQAAFDACFDSKAAMPAVKADQQEATALGVRSTPTFFINGRKLEGAVPFENFKTVIDQVLNPDAHSEAAPREAAPREAAPPAPGADPGRPG